MTIRPVSTGPAFIQRVPKILALTIMVFLGLTAWQQTTADEFIGAWEGPFCWPMGATHQAHLPPSGGSETGRILMWPATRDSLPIKSWLWNPKDGCFDENPPNNIVPGCFTEVQNNTTNLFCAGHTALADGTILTAGGHHGDISGADVGLADTNHFIRDPITGEWGDWKVFEGGIPLMAEPRWYPTVTTLPDGRALVVSGSDSSCSNSGDPCAVDGDCNGGTCDIVIIAIPEIYDPLADPPGWTPLANTAFLEIPFYPLNFVGPDGQLFYAGAEEGHGGATVGPTDTRELDIDAESWAIVGNSPNVPGGSGVMYAPGKVLKSGGGDSVAGAMVIDLNDGVPAWKAVNPMNTGRRRHQMTLLPDGTILVTGGTEEGNREYLNGCDSGTRAGAECTIAGLPPGDPGDCFGNQASGKGCPVACVLCDEGSCVGGPDATEDCNVNTDCADHGTCDGGPDAGLACNIHDDCPGEHVCIEGDQVWVATAEIYDPDDGLLGTWTDMAEAKTPRMYHSSAMLLPDGRVVSGGGGPENFGGAIHHYPTVEFFSPPYRFKEPKPEIAASRETICYDTDFQMTSSDAADVGRVTLLRLGTVTHSFDSDQRFQELSIASEEDNLFLVTAPENANDAPPGYYMLFFLSEDEDVPSIGEYVQMVETCCEPLSQGYWHRQCLGAGLITPGRNGKGRGPQNVLEPVFLKTLVPAVDVRLQASIFLPPTFFTCEHGMDAVPPNEPCERALKQYTALLLNIESGRLQEGCEIDLSSEGCISTNVGDLVVELAALINSGDPDECKQAAACAAAVNENEAIVPLVLSASSASSAPSPFGAGYDMGSSAPTAVAPPADTGTRTLTEAPAPVVFTESPTLATSGRKFPQASEAGEHSTPPATEATPIFLLTDPSVSPEAPAPEADPRTEVSAPRSSTTSRSIDRHLAVLANASTPDRDRKVTEDALLNALGGGYGLERRIEIVKALMDKVDVTLHSLLTKHLEDIRVEAEELGMDNLGKEAERLLKKLEPSQD